jgi:transmembrane protein TMEM260 (protein O-mannosyltransferase)
VLPLFIYLLTLAPSVTFFDSGEFITAISSLGVAHSPGYPLFVNYGKPFTFLPFGSIAFRVNIATAVSAALACYGVYFLTMYLLRDEEQPRGEGVLGRCAKELAGLSAAVTFACTPRLWLQSNHDKPYPLLAFLCAVIFYLMLLWRDSYRGGQERPAYVYLGAFLCGLGTGAHQIVVLMIPCYAYLLIAADRRVFFRVKEFLLALAFGLLGFAIQLHLIVRATQKPLLNWGDSKNLTQFLWNMLRKGYPTEPPDRNLALLWSQVNAFNVPFEFTAAGVFLLLAGLAALFSKKRDLVIAYLIGVLSFLLVIVGYFNTPFELIFLTEEFFTPLYLLSAVFIGVGLFSALREGARRLPATWSARPGTGLALLALLFVLPAAVCLLNYRENDQHENYIAFDYASNTLRTLPQGAVMYTWGDSGAFPLWYLQGVERMREDLDLPHTPHLVFDWYLDSMPGLFAHSQLRQVPLGQISAEDALFTSIGEQYPRRPIFIDFSTRHSVALDRFRVLQRGLCFRLEPTSVPVSPPDTGIWQLYAMRGVVGDSDMFFRDLDTGKAIMIYAYSKLEMGETLLQTGFRDQGLRELEQAVRITPELAQTRAELLNSYGVR